VGRVYPVLYMLDGQNLFEQREGGPHEWGMDEIASVLIHERKVPPFIVVGIPHAGAARIHEYLPCDAIPPAGKPAGSEFVDFLVRDIKPRVERAFRVETAPARVGIGGASLGGAIALEAALRRSDHFGLLLAESIPLATGNASAWHSWWTGRLATQGVHFTRAYFGMGGKELGNAEANVERNARYVSGLRDIERELVRMKIGPEALKVAVDPDATHDEDAWRARLPAALEFLLGPG
jgi:predicted alpha/beta superfamily hydrolase